MSSSAWMSCRWKYFALSQKSPVLIYDHCHFFSHHASQWKTCLPLLNDLIFGPISEIFHTGKVLQSLRHFSDLCWTFSSLSISFLHKEDRWSLIGVMLKEIKIFLDSVATWRVVLDGWSSIGLENFWSQPCWRSNFITWTWCDQCYANIWYKWP